MTDTALNLVEHVLPRVQIRRWVRSLPYQFRALYGYRSRLCASVVSAFAQPQPKLVGHALRREAPRAVLGKPMASREPNGR